MLKFRFVFPAAAGALLFASGCNAGMTTTPQMPQTAAATAAQPEESAGITPNFSVLKQLKHLVVIGSTVDPVNGAQNPYGLTVAPITAGKLSAGDLVICNFNGKSNVQGTGHDIVALHPVEGAKPAHVSQNKALIGCDALALAPDDTIWASAMVANDNPVLDSNGKLITNISGKPFNQPWGQAFAQPKSGPPAFYETNAGDGSVVRVNLGSTFTYDVIATGFPVNHGKPGTALAPSGLAYDAKLDTLYFADGDNNTVVALKDVSRIPAGGVKAKDHGMKFTGPSASDARVVVAGAPLNGPISTALLPNGNLVVGNTLDPAGKNLILEIATKDDKVIEIRNVDKGAAGAIFGMTVTGTSAADAKVYFNDDNANQVEMLER